MRLAVNVKRGWRRRIGVPAVAAGLALALVVVDLSGVGPVPTTPARAAAAPTIEQQLEELEREIEALAAAAPALAADAGVAVDELLNAGWELVFGTWCSMAEPLQRAVNAIDHAESIAPASLKPVIQGESAKVFRLEAFVLSLSETMCDRPDVFHVDPEVKPTDATGVDDLDGSIVPIGALADDEGVVTEFVTNEIMLDTNDAARVQAFVNRFGGRVIETLPAEPGTEGSVNQHTVRMDPARLLDTSRLAADLETLDPGWRGEIMRASDQQTLRLLATAARAAVEGYPAQLDLLVKLDSVATGVTADAPVNPPATPPGWNPNAFTWSYMRDGSTQDIEVTTAWQALDRAGLLKPTVTVGIVDSGFDARNAFSDMPAVTGYVSGPAGGPFSQHISAREGWWWHGSKVANAMAGLLDNGTGAAGPAGPVVSRMHTVNYGMGTARAWTRGIRKLRRRDTGVKIVNLSLGVSPPQRLARLAGRGGLEREIKRISDDGALVFASAGNESRNVDIRKCRWGGNGCRERRLTMPCELSRVICVGGLRPSSRARATGSNWGDTDVDIWAPYEVWVGTDTSCGGCTAQWVSGTSYSSPFAAGVAALIWTAEPSLTRDEVWDIMWRNATRVGAGNVSRIVHAGRAVNEALTVGPVG
jgi:serine protease